MATLSYPDLLKRDNVSKFVFRIAASGFKLKDENSPLYESTGKVKIIQNGKTISFDKNFGEGSLVSFLDTRKSSDSLSIELEYNKSKQYVLLTKIFKDKDLGGTASKSGTGGSERQEQGLIRNISDGIAKFGYVEIPGIKGKVIRINKKEGLSSIGKEPYIDIEIHTKEQTFGISCKDVSAPSLAGGGLAGLNISVPDLLPKVYGAVAKYMKEVLKLKQGDIVSVDSIPNMYIEISSEYLDTILRGTERMGGPVTHMYIGKMDVVADISKRKISLNGSYFEINEYKKKVGKFYFRLRKRDIEPSNTCKVEYEIKNTEGLRILLKGPKTNKNNVRMVITGEKELPRAALILTI